MTLFFLFFFQFLWLLQLLTRKDQLVQEAERGQIFSGYCEGTLAFKPTYKYNIGSSNYDTSYKVFIMSYLQNLFLCELPCIYCSNNQVVQLFTAHDLPCLQVRVPSWTDRILFKIEDSGKISATLHSYQSIDGIHSSDHKPVKAHLCLQAIKQSPLMPWSSCLKFKSQRTLSVSLKIKLTSHAPHTCMLTLLCPPSPSLIQTGPKFPKRKHSCPLTF